MQTRFGRAVALCPLDCNRQGTAAVVAGGIPAEATPPSSLGSTVDSGCIYTTFPGNEGMDIRLFRLVVG